MSTPRRAASSFDTYGSNAITTILTPSARSATTFPMAPRPTTPRTLSVISVPMNLFFSHFPAFIEAVACGIWRERAIIIEMACSPVVTVFRPGVFITTTPFLVAATLSMLSVPLPARPITLMRDACSKHAAVAFVAPRTTTASYWLMAAASSSGVIFPFTSTSIPSFVNTSMPTFCRLSSARTFMRVFSCFPVRWWSGGNATALPIKGIRKSQSREAQKTLEGGRVPCENAEDRNPARGRQRGASRGNPMRAHARTSHETDDQFQRRTRRPSPSRSGARPRRVPRLLRKRHVGDGAQPPREGVRGGPRRGDRPRPGTPRRARILRDPPAAGRSDRALRADPHELPREGKDGEVRRHRRLGAEGAGRGEARRGDVRRRDGRLEPRDRRREGQELHPRAGSFRGEGRGGRRLPAHHLQRDDPRRRIQRRSVPRVSRHGSRAADRGHVERLPLASVRRD